ncbi:urease accessory protein [Kineosphaera limosa]|uniref:urease accessory UreF family protein n=1 Tax=Kineosphaera limosa TaxID=111564 RepID=UPI000315FAAB|nr:urease accessory UreF family protein [Kineosphaera limosa]NYD99447.1 urease accessory protein [Kineosphaera limosa]
MSGLVEAPTVQYALMLLADARLPSGGHTMSAGLEPALLAGLTAEQVPAFLRARLVTTVRVDAATAVVARHACATAAPPAAGSFAPSTELAAVAQAWAARTPSEVLRAAGELAGRGLYRVLAHVHPEVGRGVAPLVRERRAWRPVVLGALAHALALDSAATALLAAYDDIQTVTCAALKLLPLDPLTTLDWSLAARADVTTLVAQVAGLTDPDDIPACAAPQLEAWHQRHAAADRRLFRV